jgi:hypothetical protein
MKIYIVKVGKVEKCVFTRPLRRINVSTALLVAELPRRRAVRRGKETKKDYASMFFVY